LSNFQPKIGDLIADIDSGTVGILIEKHKKIYVEFGETCYWEIHWIGDTNRSAYIEEEYLTYTLEVGILQIIGGTNNDY
jgi:hypothetical protein